MQLVLSLSPGGTERLVTQIVRRLPSSFRTVVCCLDRAGVWGEELRRSGVPVIALERDPGFRPMLAKRIARAAVEYGVEVIHCHQYSPYVYGQLAARLLSGVRVVFTEHGRLSAGRPSLKRRLANHVLARLPANVFTVSEDLKHHLVDEGFPAARINIITNGIDVARSREQDVRARIRTELGLAPDTYVIGTVGRLDPVKDLGTLVRGFAQFRDRVPRAVLIVVGDGPEREPLASLASTLRLSGAVTFLGHREDVHDVLYAFDVYAGTSTFEGISLTILEAMAAERPVVATAVGGTPEVVVDGVTGRLIPSQDPIALASALSALHENQAMADMWGHAGRERVLERFTIDGMVQQYAAVYRGRDF
jgi:glycosyltransferase involved in cell wall biosynthesis